MSNISLKEIVGSFLDSHNYSKSEYRKAYSIAIRGWRKLNWDVTGKLFTEPIEVDCDLTAKLPDGVISITKIGVVNDKGEVATLTKNENLSFDISTPPDYHRDFPIPFGSHDSVNSYYSGVSYGIGSHTSIGDYRVNKSEGRVYFKPDFCYSEVIVEYVGHQMIDGEYCINEMASEALLAFIRWQWAVGDRNVGIGERNQLKREWISERSDAHFRIKRPTMSELNQVSRQSTKWGLKG